MNLKLFNGDCLEILKGAHDNSIDSIVTDPPYGLSFMSKKWDYAVPSIDIWKECLRVLKPGGHLLAFGSTRTYHRLVVAIEDAGFEIRDQIQWIYGQGFPKSQDISKALDKAAGVERELGPTVGELSGRNIENHKKGHEIFAQVNGWDKPTSKPSSPDAQKWSGWGTNLKPANEPICLARKPLSESTIAKNVLLHGTGGLNIDSCRIAASTEDVGDINRFEKGGAGFRYKEVELKEALERGETKTKDGRSIDHALAYIGTAHRKQIEAMQKMASSGRFPSNVILDEDAAAVLDVQSGMSKSPIGPVKGTKSKGGIMNGTGESRVSNSDHGDSGGASRFFYVAKSSKSDRNSGLAGTDIVNDHATVKPIKLMEYLIKLITPEGGIVLDPFMGSGSTGVAAIRNGFQFRGIEMDEAYFNICQSRIENAWQGIEGTSKEASI